MKKAEQRTSLVRKVCCFSLNRIGGRIGCFHFHDNHLPAFCPAMQIKNGTPIQFRPSELVMGGIFQIFDIVVFRQDGVQKINQQILDGVIAKDFLKTKIGVWIDVARLHMQLFLPWSVLSPANCRAFPAPPSKISLGKGERSGKLQETTKAGVVKHNRCLL